MFGKKHSDTTKQIQKEKAKGRYSLSWYIERYGENEGNIKYKERCNKLSKRIFYRDPDGNFIKKQKGLD